MAYLVPESFACIDMEGIEVDGAFLMSLLEEPQYEGNDEERLNSLIQSLQAEISPVSTKEARPGVEEEEEESSCSMTTDVDFNWMGMEMEMVPCAPSNDMNWCMDRYVDDIRGMAEFGDVMDYVEICNGIQLEGSLWQESYDDTVMFQSKF